MRTLLAAAVVVASLAMPSASSAQSTVYLMFEGTCATGATPCAASQIWQVDAERGQILARYPTACAGRNLTITADGRFLVYIEACGTAPSVLRGIDTTTGASFPLGGAPAAFVSHPSQIRLLWAEGDTIVSLTPAGRTSVPTSGCTNRPFTLSGDGARLLQTCAAGPVVRRTDTGAVVRQLTLAAGESMAIGETGDAIYRLATGTGATFRGQTISRIGVATGSESLPQALLADTIQGNGGLGFDRRTGRPVIATGGFVEPFDPVTLAPRPSFRSGSTFSAPPVFHPVASRAYGVWSVNPSWIDVTDVDQSLRLATVDVAPGDRILGVVVAPHPPAPVSLVSTVVARRVTLTWAAGPRSPLLTGYELDVATAPAGPAVVRVPLTTATFVADNVPPGTYYARVRARNYAGLSAASTEIVIAVP